VLRAQRTLRQDTQYTVKGAPDAPRTVLIEQPRRAGWKFESKELAGETATHYRMKVNVPAGGSATVRASMTRQEPQTVALLDADEQTLAAWSTHVADEHTRRQLERLAQLRQALSEAQRQEQALDSELSSAEQNQARIRDNLAAVPADSTLGQRYLNMLEKEEDGLQALRQRKQAAQQETASRRRAMEQALSPA